MPSWLLVPQRTGRPLGGSLYARGERERTCNNPKVRRPLLLQMNKSAVLHPCVALPCFCSYFAARQWKCLLGSLAAQGAPKWL